MQPEPVNISWILSLSAENAAGSEDYVDLGAEHISDPSEARPNQPARPTSTVDGSRDIHLSQSTANCVAFKRKLVYPARALSALVGLLLADGAPTVWWGKTFFCVGGSPSRKRL